MGRGFGAWLLLVSRCTVSEIVFPAFQSASSRIDGVLYDCDSFHPEAIRSALLGTVYQVLLLALNGKEFRSHSLIHLSMATFSFACPKYVCMCIYYQHAFQQL